MKLHHLRDVIAVAEAGSLRAASRKSGLSQSTMTKSIQYLEKEIGAPIFERQQRGTVLTPLGALFVQRARVATGELSRAREEIQQHLGGGDGRVVACLSTVPHMALLPEVLPQFLERYPRVQLSVVEGLGFSAAETAMRDGEIDFYIGLGPSHSLPGEFVLEKLFDNERCVVCRKGHPQAEATSLKALMDDRWSMSSPAFDDEEFAALFQRHGLPVPASRTFGGSILGQIVFVLHADILAIVPRQWLAFAPLQGWIQEVPIKEKIGAPAIVMVRRASLPLTPAAEYFCDLVRRASRHMPEQLTTMTALETRVG